MISKLFRWQYGRQKTGYRIWPFAQATWPFKFDAYIIHYPVGSGIPPHKDPVPFGLKHYRINIELWRGEGGNFHCADTIFHWWRLYFFRPDINLHYVTKVTKGNRYVLSVGWVS